MTNRRSFLFVTAAMASVLSTMPHPVAQEAFPTRGVRLIVPFAAGSILDTLARVVADGLSRKWRQPVVVENIAGSAGNAGTERFARSAPDGYTLLAAPPGPYTMNKLLFKEMSYDASTFTPISLLGTVPVGLVVRNDFPARTFEEFIEYVRKNPGKVSYASQGVGTTPFLIAKLVEARANVEMMHVPYRGSALAQTDLAAGHIDCFFDAISNALPVMQSGQARILAVTDSNRVPQLPDVPRIAEFYPGFRAISWFALAAPAGAPPALAERISRDVAEILSTPSISAKLRETGLNTVGNTPQETAKFLAEEDLVWSKLVKDIDLKPQ
jgi:tripartite-type tricarboxylate transporter receptor subunit TctC